jgi:hypothetical protein
MYVQDLGIWSLSDSWPLPSGTQDYLLNRQVGDENEGSAVLVDTFLQHGDFVANAPSDPKLLQVNNRAVHVVGAACKLLTSRDTARSATWRRR